MPQPNPTQPQINLVLSIKWITDQDLPHSTWDSAPCDAAAGTGGGVWGRTHNVYVWLRPSAVHLRLSLYYLLISCTQVLDKTLKRIYGSNKEQACGCRGRGE